MRATRRVPILLASVVVAAALAGLFGVREDVRQRDAGIVVAGGDGRAAAARASGCGRCGSGRCGSKPGSGSRERGGWGLSIYVATNGDAGRCA